MSIAPRFRTETADAGGPIAYADFGGEGPTLVLLHGLGGCHLNWLPAAPMMARHGRVLALDLVGFGRTPTAGRAHGIDGQLAMIDRFLAEVVRGPAVLVGNSMGGLLALLLAARAPDRVSGLVLVSPALPLPLSTPLTLDAASRNRFLLQAVPGLGELSLFLSGLQIGARGLFLDLLTLGTKDVTRVPREVVEANVALLEERMEEQPFRYAQSYFDASRSLLWHLARRERVDASIRAVRAPTLVVHGAADRIMPSSASRRVASLRPDWTIDVLDDVGHVPQMEDAPRFVDRMAAWLAREGLARPPRSGRASSFELQRSLAG